MSAAPNGKVVGYNQPLRCQQMVWRSGIGRPRQYCSVTDGRCHVKPLFAKTCEGEGRVQTLGAETYVVQNGILYVKSDGVTHLVVPSVVGLLCYTLPILYHGPDILHTRKHTKDSVPIFFGLLYILTCSHTVPHALFVIKLVLFAGQPESLCIYYQWSPLHLEGLQWT